MFKWLSKILTPSVDKAQEEAKVIQKTVTKNGVGHAPKIEPVITEVKKATAKKATAKKPAAKKTKK